MAGRTYTIEIDLEVQGAEELNKVTKSVNDVVAKSNGASTAFMKIGKGIKSAGLAVKGFGAAVSGAFGGAVFALVTRIIDAFVQMEPVTKALEYAFKFIEVAVSKSVEAFKALFSLDFAKFWEIAKSVKTTTDSIVDLNKAIEGLNISMASLEVKLGTMTFIAGLHRKAIDDTTASFKYRNEQAKAWYDQMMSINAEQLVSLENEKNLYLQMAATAANEKERVEASAKALQLQRQINDITQSAVSISAEYNSIVKELNAERIAYLQSLRGDDEIKALESRGAQVVQTEQDIAIQQREIYKNTADYKKKLDKQQLDNTIHTAQAGLAAVSVIFGALAAANADNFETQKKYQIAEATVNTIQGMVTAFTGAMQLGPIAGPIVGAVLAAAVGVMGYMNIDKIKNTKPEGGGSMGSASVPNISTPQQGGAPGFGLINPLTSGEASISSAFDTAQQPIQAYVVSSHVSSQQELDRNIVANAEI